VSDGKMVGPLRVWKKGSNYPGLMMSRSFGDGLGHEVGIISTPEISEKRLIDDSKILIVGSDGLLEIVPDKKISEKLYYLVKTNRKNEIVKYLDKFSSDAWKAVSLPQIYLYLIRKLIWLERKV
jgi:serine/threonine protein phosphatase PrpC